jgi:hypothetical protein
VENIDWNIVDEFAERVKRAVATNADNLTTTTMTFSLYHLREVSRAAELAMRPEAQAAVKLIEARAEVARLEEILQ